MMIAAAAVERAREPFEDDLAAISHKVALVSPVNRLDILQAEISKIAPAIVTRKHFVVDRLKAIRAAHPAHADYLAAIQADAVLNAAHAEFLDAVDRLQAITDETGLTNTFGQDAIQQVLADGLTEMLP